MSKLPVGSRTWRGRVFIGVSLDGYIARGDGDIEWLTDPAQGDHAATHSSRHAVGWNDFFPRVSHLVMGRGTFEKVLTFGFWPYEGKRVFVLSRTLEQGEHGVEIVRTPDDAVALLNAQGARDVYVDGGQVIQTFLRAGLIDEITVSVAPVLLGEGIRLFGVLDRDCRLDLVGSHADEAGTVHSTYEVRAESESAETGLLR